MAPSGQDVAAFLGKETDPGAVALAEQHVQIVTAMARAYTRGRGFSAAGDPSEDVAAVITTATARLVTNPGQLAYDQSAGQFSTSVRDSFAGWTLAELFVLNRYRRKAQ
ncbi:hypothetical protein GCM10023217_26970 [Gordonia alkaliphila]|uniref:TetR family transcriptional regulator n=1 Tax=Gordonia alkaliphila TaxID=1053547 RepID=A0ABP8ZEC8_9ACTN